MEILEANLDAMYMDAEDERLGRVPFLAQMGGPPGALAAMPEAFKEVVPEVASGSLKGLISGIGGTPGEVAGLLSGLMNTISPRNYKGEPHAEGMSIGDRFIQGYEAVPFKTEDIRDALTEAGLKIEYLNEHNESPYNVLPDLKETKSGMYVTKDKLYPLIFEIKAVKL